MRPYNLMHIVRDVFIKFAILYCENGEASIKVFAKLFSKSGNETNFVFSIDFDT